jgi:hypothetical protein
MEDIGRFLSWMRDNTRPTMPHILAARPQWTVRGIARRSFIADVRYHGNQIVEVLKDSIIADICLKGTDT